MLRSRVLASLQAWQASLSPGATLYVAFSGGLDSHVLLHLVCSLRDEMDYRLAAIHVNHHLHVDSDAWAEHCQRLTHRYGIALHGVDIAANDGDGSPEERARTQRYAEMARVLQTGDLLLTAHHLDDQLETFFLQLFRGAGVLGLAAMPAIKRFARGWHGRPLLPFQRQQLVDYAGQHQLQWVEDTSNADRRYDRNHIRHALMPVIKRRWPHVAAPLSRYIGIAADTQQLVDALAGGDLDQASSDKKQRLLNCEIIAGLPVARQNNLLRYWLRRRDLPLPAARHLGELRRSLIKASPDKAGVVSWPGAKVYRYRNCLYATDKTFTTTCHALINWSLPDKLMIAGGELRANRMRGRGLKQGLCGDGSVRVGFYQGGERIRLPQRAHHSRLKKLFQAVGLPPWQRRWVPFIYINEQLAMVVGLWTAAEFIAGEHDPGWDISWSLFDQLIFIAKK